MENTNTVQKTVDILQYLSTHPNGAALSAIAKELRFPKTSVYNILKTLVQNNFIQCVIQGKKNYCIGSHAYITGYTYLESSELFKAARPYLTLLADKYEKTAFLSIRDRDQAIFIYKYASLNVKTIMGDVGERRLLHASAVGKCFLAFDTGAFPLIDTIDLPAFTPYTITVRKKLKAHLGELRKLGYSWEQREYYIHTSCLAAPIFIRGAMAGAISMVGWYKEEEDLTAQGNEIAQLANLITTQLEQDRK